MSNTLDTLTRDEDAYVEMIEDKNVRSKLSNIQVAYTSPNWEYKMFAVVQYSTMYKNHLLQELSKVVRYVIQPYQVIPKNVRFLILED